MYVSIGIKGLSIIGAWFYMHYATVQATQVIKYMSESSEVVQGSAQHSLPIVEPNENPAEFWKREIKQYPNLSDLALGVPASHLLQVKGFLDLNAVILKLAF